MRRININPTVASTSEPLRSDQVPTNSGGYGWSVTPIDQLRKFITLGVTSGTYYVTEKDLTKTNVDNIKRLIASNGVDVVHELVLFAEQNRAPKKEPMIFTLAMCAILGDDKTKKAANAALPIICRIPTDLFSFIEYMEAISAPKHGWGASRRKAIAKWYNEKSIKDLVYHVTKYKQRNGWSNRDVLRLCHAKAPNNDHNLIYRFVTKGTLEFDPATLSGPEAIEAFDRLVACDEIMRLKANEANDIKRAVDLIHKYRLVHEHVPTEMQAKAEIWEALLPEMPLTALIRNLGRLTSLGLLTPNGDNTLLVIKKLSDEIALRRAKIHPYNVLTAALQYASNGRTGKGKLTWNAIGQINTLLEDVYYKTFGTLEPSGKRLFLGLDVSASMKCAVTGSEVITCNVAAAAMSMVALKTEIASVVMGFDHGIRDMGIGRNDRLDDVTRKVTAINGGGTDCSLPMIYAAQHKIPVDLFCVYTDSENNPGRYPPTRALNDYREKMGIDARLAVICLSSSHSTIADPNDKGMMDLVGFDSATPRILADFASGFF